MTDELREILFFALGAYLWVEKLTMPDMLFSFVPPLVDKHLPEKLSYPLYRCAVCVCGFWYLVFLLASLTPLHVCAERLIFAMAITQAVQKTLA